jgi:hypothetical protein
MYASRTPVNVRPRYPCLSNVSIYGKTPVRIVCFCGNEGPIAIFNTQLRSFAPQPRDLDYARGRVTTMTGMLEA